MNILQHLVFPNFDIEAPDDLYVRPWGGAVVSRSEKQVNFYQKGSGCAFDTFFNSLTIQTWKNETPVRQIKLRLFGKGEFFIRIRRHKLHTEMRHLSEQKITLTEQGVDVDFGNLEDHTEGMLFFELISLADDNFINKGFYYTELAPVNSVKLGIVITHFNRKHYVLPAIDRVSKDLLQDPYFKDKISLIVVDNSQNITPEEAQCAIVIPNQNLGGSGGFTRGLMYLEDQKDYTHCLFMDDDASCEIESIRRAYALLQYTTTEKFAVSGAQLRELAPTVIHEKGACFRKQRIASLHHGRDIRHVHELLLAEQNELQANYGAWWFFAFKIKDVSHHPFPFFVRGDDISFSLYNNFKVCTLNGIGVWGEDFWVKESPMTRYLGVRSFLACHILGDTGVTKKELKQNFKVWYLGCINSYNYTSAKAIYFALVNSLLGTKLYSCDIDANKARSKIAALPQDEKMKPIRREDYELKFVAHPSKNRCRMRKWIRKLTLNYLLMPECVMKKGVVFQPKHFSANLDQTYRFKEIYYEHEATRTGYVVKFDRQRLWQAYKDYFAALKLIDEKFDSAKADYLAHQDELTSRAFWEKVYSQDLKK